MTIVDDRILEYIRENEHGSPTEMKEEGPIRYSRQYISQRCQKLADHGLLKPVGNGVYIITERGEKYLDAELDTHVDQPDETNGNSNVEQPSITEESEDTA
jgi:Mn-dependent DtxR family transcriptional regulator